MYVKNVKKISIKIPTSVLGQIQSIVNHFDTEVSWYGDITQKDDTTYLINKVYLFPQVVTGGTFRTDTPQITELYDQWYNDKLDQMLKDFEETGEFSPIMQYNGHSHVNMGPSASGEDIKFRKSRTGLNIYSIQNKKGESKWEVWTDEYVYEDEDISIFYVDDIFANATEYVQKEKKVVVPTAGTVIPKKGKGKKDKALATTANDKLTGFTDEEIDNLQQELLEEEWSYYNKAKNYVYGGYGYGGRGY